MTPASADARTDGSAAMTPLVVDVDGTLVRTDLLHEAALQFVARHPLEAWRLLAWTVAGKVRLKSSLAERVGCGADTVPLREEVVAVIREAQSQRRPVYLASASDRRYVEMLAERIGGIDGIFATDSDENLAGESKAKRLDSVFGQYGYDYIGNSKVDFPVWKAAREVLVASHSPRFSRSVRRAFPHAQVLAEEAPGVRDYWRALRPHQWAKNILVFLALIAGHRFTTEVILETFVAFVCFCAAASSAYIINDLLDLPSDREHERKRNRPFASGAIPISHGPPIALALLVVAVGAAWLLSPEFAAVLIVYVGLTLAYSLVLKRHALIDVITLGGLYTIRVLGGVAAIEIEQSPWLMMFSLFLFLSLAIVKRCSELVVRRAAGNAATVGRGYLVEDLNLLLGLGSAAGYGAVLVVALYIFSPEVQKLYLNPERLWLICPLLLYWISRILMLSNRGTLHDDPLIFALSDRVSWIVGVCASLVVVLAL